MTLPIIGNKGKYINIPYEAVHYFGKEHAQAGALLVVLKYADKFKVGHTDGSGHLKLDVKAIAKTMEASTSSIYRWLAVLRSLKMVKKVRDPKDTRSSLLKVSGWGRVVREIRNASDTTRFALGLSQDSADRKYIEALRSSRVKVIRLLAEETFAFELADLLKTIPISQSCYTQTWQIERQTKIGRSAQKEANAKMPVKDAQLSNAKIAKWFDISESKASKLKGLAKKLRLIDIQNRKYETGLPGELLGQFQSELENGKAFVGKDGTIQVQLATKLIPLPRPSRRYLLRILNGDFTTHKVYRSNRIVSTGVRSYPSLVRTQL